MLSPVHEAFTPGLRDVMTYLIAYFIVNLIVAGLIVRNVYFVPHTPDYRRELREEFWFYLGLALLFGAILIVMEYVFRTMDGE